MINNKDKYIAQLKRKFESYSPITEESWELIKSIIRFQELKKGEVLLQNGEVAAEVHNSAVELPFCRIIKPL